MSALALVAFVAALLGDAAARTVRQPIDFSHRRHAERGLKCAFCHRTARTAEAAGLPGSSLCLDCHRAIEPDGAVTRLLARHADGGEPIRWVRVYRLPSFVFFGHERHTAAGVECERCHGAVAKRDVLAREGDLSMKACIDCHKASRATTVCNRCHEIER